MNYVSIINDLMESNNLESRVNKSEKGKDGKEIVSGDFNLKSDGSRQNRLKKVINTLKDYLGEEHISYTIKGGELSFFIGKGEQNFITLKELYKRVDPEALDNLILPVGQDSNGNVVNIDLENAPHLLIAGTTGSGKSVFLKALIVSALLNVKNLSLVIVDPKRVDFKVFKELKNTYVASDMRTAYGIFQKLVQLMEERYKALEGANVTNIGEYNNTVKNDSDKMDYFIIIVDELSDLMMSFPDVKTPLITLGQKARACGIHMILATQRPSADIFPPLLKAVVPSRIALKVDGKNNSRIILDEPGAEGLRGKGEFIYKNEAGLKVKGQSAFIDNNELKEFISTYKEQHKNKNKSEVSSKEKDYLNKNSDFISYKNLASARGASKDSLEYALAGMLDKGNKDYYEYKNK